MKEVTYLDHNATTPMCRQAQEAMSLVWNMPLNASSIHSYGRNARKLLEESKESILSAAGASETRLITTSSGTEANNLAMKGLDNVDILVSAIEHLSILKSADYSGVIPVDENGIIRLDALENLLKNNTRKTLISVMLANNETGTIQPIKEVVMIAKKYGAYVHSDAIQAFGKIPVSMDDLGVDMITISAHKLGGPIGSAALLVKKPLTLKAQITGGGQEQGFRSGTENVAAIIGFSSAVESRKKLGANDNIRALRDWMEDRLEKIAGNGIIISKNSSRLPNTCCIQMPNVSNETQLIHFDMENIAVSAGSACSSGKVEISHVLLAAGIDKEIASQTIRVSLGVNTKRNEIEKFINSWEKLYIRMNKEKLSITNN